MPVGVSKSSREKYKAALREIDRAIVDLGEGLRYDTDTNKKFIKITISELRDAAKRIRKRMREGGDENV